MNESLIAILFMVAITGFICSSTIISLFDIPFRKKHFSLLAKKYGLIHTPLITVSQVKAIKTLIRQKVDKAGQERNGALPTNNDPRREWVIRTPCLSSDSVFSDFRFFNIMNTAKILNHCTGNVGGVKIEVFDHFSSKGTYRRTPSSLPIGKKTQKKTVVAFRLPDKALPWFVIRPFVNEKNKGLWDLVPQNKSREFNNVYLITTDHEIKSKKLQIEAALSRDLMVFLADNRGYRIRVGDDIVVITKNERKVKPSALSEMVEVSVRIADMLVKNW